MNEEKVLRKALENYNIIMEQAVLRLEKQDGDLRLIKTLVADAIKTDGAHHKQWFLCQIGLICGLSIDYSAIDGGIAP